MRGSSSVASAANAAIEHVRDEQRGHAGLDLRGGRLARRVRRAGRPRLLVPRHVRRQRLPRRRGAARSTAAPAAASTRRSPNSSPSATPCATLGVALTSWKRCSRVILAVVVIAVATALAPEAEHRRAAARSCSSGSASACSRSSRRSRSTPRSSSSACCRRCSTRRRSRCPPIEFRRDFGPIAGLSVLLVVLSSAALGVFFLARRSPDYRPLPRDRPRRDPESDRCCRDLDREAARHLARVVTMLEGESLLNDATALVLLRTMIAAAAVATWAARRGRRRARVRPGLPVGRARRRRDRRARRLLNLRVRALLRPLRGEHRDRLRRAVRRLPPDRAAGRIRARRGGGRGHRDRPGRRALVHPGAAALGRAQLAHDRAHARGRGLPAHGPRAQGDRRRRTSRTTTGSGTGIGSRARRARRSSSSSRAAYVAMLVWLQSRRARGKQRERLEADHRRLDEIAGRRHARRTRTAEAGRGATRTCPETRAAKTTPRGDAHARRAGARATSTTTRRRRWAGSTAP